MSRDIVFEPMAVCDECGAGGAYDFMGDYLCMACSQKYIVPEPEADDVDDEEEDDAVDALMALFEMLD